MNSYVLLLILSIFLSHFPAVESVNLQAQLQEEKDKRAAEQQRLKAWFGVFGNSSRFDVCNVVKHDELYGYGSIPINTIFRGMNIHLPAILMFTRGTRF